MTRYGPWEEGYTWELRPYAQRSQAVRDAVEDTERFAASHELFGRGQVPSSLPCVCHAVAPSVEASGGMPCVCHAVAPSVASFFHYGISERKYVPAAVAMRPTERFLGRPLKHAHSRVLFRVCQCLFARWGTRARVRVRDLSEGGEEGDKEGDK